MALSNTTKSWLHGLGAAFIGASAATLTTVLSAPQQYNFTTRSGLVHIALSAVVAGVGSAAAYLLKSPLPGTVTAVEEKKVVETPEATTTTTTTAVKQE